MAARTRSLPELAQLRSSSLLIIASTGVSNVLSTVCFMLSIATVAGTPSVLTATSPVFAVLLAMLFLRELPERESRSAPCAP